MIRRTLLVAAWLGAGSAVLAALYWLFLNTPESNTLMLVASLLLALALIGVAAVTGTGAVLLARGASLRTSLAGVAGRVGWFVVAVVPVAAVIWLINAGDAWIAARSGEISAWFIAQFGWADVTPMFTALSYFSVWLRWVLLPVLGVAALASLLSRESMPPAPWKRIAPNWRTLLIATVAFVLLVALPWRAAFWQTQWRPHAWLEPTVAAVRLAAVGVLIVTGFAIIVVTAARQAVQVSEHVKT